MSRAVRPVAAFAALVLAAVGPDVRAESTVIRDTRLENLGMTPALGRGFTPAISSLHSVCFDKMPTTTASYDFDYTFEELTATSSRRSHEVDEFVREHARETTVVDGATRQHLHHVLALLVVESYYASIDEAHAELSANALKLLGSGDVHGFFTGCGTHYIRSMSRRSYFLTMFSYSSSAKTRDRAFELRLEQQVRKFQGGASPEDQELDRRFTEQARTRSLRVVTRSIGLPARGNADLLPFDLASYKQAVKEAFKASQEPGAGRVTAMEIMPWLSNTRVLVTLDLGAAGVDKDNWTERKRILSDNAEFYIELAAAIQEMQTQVHRAEACRRELEEVIEDGKLSPRFAGAKVVSHRSGVRAPLAALVEAVSDANIDRMRALGLAWRGGADGKSGAAACMDELERTALSGRYHNEIAACEWKRVRLPNAALIDEHCPPNIEVAGASP